MHLDTEILQREHEPLPAGELPQIAGILREPLVRVSAPDQLSVSYHWETPNDEHTYLYLNLDKSQDGLTINARANMDSEDIRGQGDALWAFMGSQLQQFSDRSNLTVLHDVSANEYSKRLPEADPKYVQVGEGKYRGTFTPTIDADTIDNYS